MQSISPAMTEIIAISGAGQQLKSESDEFASSERELDTALSAASEDARRTLRAESYDDASFQFISHTDEIIHFLWTFRQNSENVSWCGIAFQSLQNFWYWIRKFDESLQSLPTDSCEILEKRRIFENVADLLWVWHIIHVVVEEVVHQPALAGGNRNIYY